MPVANNARIARIHIRGAVEQPVGHAIRARVQTEPRTAQRVMQVSIDHRPIVRTERAPHKVVAVPYRRDPGRAPPGPVRPQPAIRAVVGPSAIVRRHIGKGIVVNPAVPVRRHVTPIPVAVRDVVHNRRGPPVVAAVDVNPITIRTKRCRTNHRSLDDLGGK